MEHIIGNPADWDITRHVYMSFGRVNLADNEVFIEKCLLSEDKQYSVTVPNIINDKKVVGIYDNAFCNLIFDYNNERDFSSDNTALREVIIPEGIKYLGNSVFEKCVNLEKVQLPSSLVFIGEHCFYECKSLKKIRIPDDVEIIPHFAFCGCSKLESIIFPKRLKLIQQGAFIGCNMKSIVLNEGVEELERGALSGLENLRVAVFPKSLVTIGPDIFGLMNYDPVEKESKSIRNINRTIYCYPGSYALLYAKENGYMIKSADIL